MPRMIFKFYCQKCSKQIEKKDRLILRIEDIDGMFQKQLRRVQLCKECMKSYEKEMKKMEGRRSIVAKRNGSHE